MRIDSYKTLVMDHVSWPGNIGDSCAETCRYAHLKILLGLPVDDVDITQFISNTGFLRHPLAPAAGEIDGNNESWRESDFTSDQGVPLFLAARKIDWHLAAIINSRIANDGYKTGNGDLIHPGFYALLKDWPILLSASSDVQALLLRFPYRWSDSKNRFEENEESAADYLNWIHCAVYLSPWERRLIPKDLLKAKIRKYYEPEPNCQFLIDLYDQVIDKYF